MSDLIERQVAIDALKGLPTWWADGGGYYGGAQPPMVALLDPKDAVSAIENLPSAQPEQRWIPCSERLPEESGRYLISALDGIGRRTAVAPYQPRYKTWTMTGRMAYWKVIAWMPLIEPYQLKENEQ